MKKILSLLFFFLFTTTAYAVTIGPVMNVSGQGSDYIFVYRGNGPNEFDALVAQGLGNLSGWTATCGPNQPCQGKTYIIDRATQPDPNYLYLYTTDRSGNVDWPDSGRWYIFESPAPPPTPLCCGGSATPFNANPAFVNRVQQFVQSGTGDNKVSIEQIGNNNRVTVTQQGAKNSVSIYNNGSNNNIQTTQTTANSSIANVAELNLNGNNNVVNYTQQSTGGVKGTTSIVSGNNNTVNVQQKDTGNHYLELSLSGGNKTVDILQQGTAAHMANITLNGGATAISTTQSGSTAQSYSITHTCANISCAAITVTQGQ
jgi:hypothetical protein